MSYLLLLFSFFFFNDTATTEIYTLSLHDALPISGACSMTRACNCASAMGWPWWSAPRSVSTSRSWTSPTPTRLPARSEEHTSELQSHLNLVCRLLLEKKKKYTPPNQQTAGRPVAC